MKYERRKILTCFAVLFALCFIVIVAGRMMVSGNRLKVAWKLDEEEIPENPDQLRIEWDQGEMTVVDLEMLEDDVLMIELAPKEAKENTYKVVDR